ncbi:Hypothetical protein PHPALM_18562 [Phytophthora palmivora]|uniref:Reverse transcriptase/retrotransposon-derived protein RNase H-like domain-containing protein n=1 Tax=Phytophthora palmivora TaxID=4796 RepID=A0A2P4XJE9_9STRA|nr:Hypothetical protein PHPALM_18562 [Phytophthora palmivora]
MMVDLHPEEIRGYWKQQDPDLWFKPTDQEDTPVTQKPSQIKEIRRSEVMDLLPGESRGYWKHYAPGKWFRQAKIAGKINNEKGILFLDTGAEVSIVDTAFARKVGCYIDTSQIQDCVGIGDSVYKTEGKTRIKITMAGSLVYFFDIWVGDLTGQDAILGMDFMVPAGIRLDLAYGSISLPDEVRIQLSGRRQLYSDKARLVTVGEHIQIEIGQSVELRLHLRTSDHEKFWVTRGDHWVPTVVKGLEKRRYLQITNISDKTITLQKDVRIGIWLAGDHIPRMPGFVSIYQRPIDNALYGFTRIPPPGSDPRSTHVFEVGEADDPGKPSVIGRRSYIDDILIPADSWDQLCDRVDALLEACDKWNLSISVVKSFWGMSKVEYLGHRVSKDGLEANPKDLKVLTDLAFPGSLRSVQSFLGSLNYYSRFIEDYAIYAAVLYELTEVDFAAMSKGDMRIQIKRCMERTELDQLDLKEDLGSDMTLKPMETSDPEGLDGEQVDSRWIRAHRTFETLKSKIASTPILRHFDIDREAVVIVYASDWAISAALVQEYDQIYYPITFVSRTLKSNELNYSPVEKEVLALLRGYKGD